MQGEIRDRQMASDSLTITVALGWQGHHETHCFAPKEPFSRRTELGMLPRRPLEL